jgi:hypothetical protein
MTRASGHASGEQARYTAPDPRDFETVIDWLRTAVAGQSLIRVALGAGLSKNALSEWLAHPDRKPTVTTVDRLAAYFDVDRVELRALLALMPKNPNRVAAGRAIVDNMGRERVQASLAAAQAKLANYRPEQLKVQGAAARRCRSADEWSQMQSAASEVRRARGWMSPAERAAMSERVRRTGQSTKAARASHSQYGAAHPGLLALRAMWAKSETRTLQRIRFWAYLHSRGYLRKRLLARAHAEHNRLKAATSGPGRRPKLLADTARALEAARLRDEEHLTKGEIAVRLGLVVYQDESGYTRANRFVDELIELGRALGLPSRSAG